LSRARLSIKKYLTRTNQTAEDAEQRKAEEKENVKKTIHDCYGFAAFLIHTSRSRRSEPVPI
ncbi:MAG: hypothetical protein AABZ10_00435, partial [Nitrospirota bacterium]